MTDLHELNSKPKRAVKAFTFIFSILLLSNCGGSGGNGERPCERDPDSCVLEDPPPVEIWWDSPLPDFSENPDRPTVTLLGNRTQLLTLGDRYQERGATAEDTQDGDISSQIEITGEVATEVVGDYLLRYLVTDSSGLIAIEQTRIVRVIGAVAKNISRRPLGSSIANFGYLEHLPVNYGQTAGQKPPLLIYLHGAGGNAQFANTTDPTLALDSVIGNFGPPKLIEDGQWDNTLPFVVLAPLLGAVPSAGYMPRLDAFLEYAIRAYDVDVSRIYLAGWSNGGFISYDFAVNFPDKIAAVTPLSSGLPYELDELPDNFCDVQSVPMWLFHATDDVEIPHGNSIKGYSAILDNCQPRVWPKLSIMIGGEHAIHHAVFDLSALVGGSLDAEYDSRFDPYFGSIYQWLLSHSLNDR